MKRFFSKIGRFFWSWGFLKFVLGLIALIVLLYIEEDVRGAHAWAVTKAKWEAKGETFDYAKFIPPPVPDEQNLAALPIFDLKPDPEPYAKGMLSPMRLRHALGEDLHGGMLPSMSESPNTIRAGVEAAFKSVFKEAAPPASALAQFDALYPVIGELREAATARPECRFKEDYAIEPPFPRPFGLLTTQINVAKKAAYHAKLALLENKPDVALSDIELNLRLAAGVERDPTLVAGLVTLGIVAIDRGVIEDGLTHYARNDAQLAELQRQLATFDFLSRYEYAMKGELVTGAVAMLDYTKTVHQKGERLRGESEKVLDDDIGFSHWPGGWLDLNKSKIVDFDLRVLEGVDPKKRLVHPEIARNLEVELQRDEAIPWRFAPWNIIFALTMPSLTNAQVKFAQAQVWNDQLLIACALERYRLAHGVYPGKLEELVPACIDELPHDIMNGEAYRYRLNPDGRFLLYSVGWNQTDDGGTVVFKNESKTAVDYEQGDWVWPTPKPAAGK